MINMPRSHGVLFDINDLFPEVVILLKGDPVKHPDKQRLASGFQEVPGRLMSN